MKQKSVTIGILAYHGDVLEHKDALNRAFQNLNIKGFVREVRTGVDLQDLSGLIIPGGESTVMYKLSSVFNIFEKINKIPNIFGTCAGAIMLSKKIRHQAADQQSLGLMDIEIDRNAYGRQTDSFETGLITPLGNIKGIFIRAPRIVKTGTGVHSLVELKGEIVACEQRVGKKYYLATCFHPEMTTTKFHEYFIKKIIA